MRKIYFDKWFADGFMPESPSVMPRYGDDSDRYEYCECLVRTYRNEGELSHVFENIRKLVQERYGVEIIGIRLEPYKDRNNRETFNTIRLGTLDEFENEDKMTDKEFCKELSKLTGIDVESFYIANEKQNFHWKFFIDAGYEVAKEFSKEAGISEIRVNSNWAIEVFYEFDEDLFKHKEDMLDVRIASRAYDIYDSMDYLDSDHEKMRIRFTSVESESERIMKPVSDPEPLFQGKRPFSSIRSVSHVRKFTDARGYLFVEIGNVRGDRETYVVTDLYKFPPKTSITLENYREVLSIDYEMYPQYVITKENFEFMSEPLYGIKRRSSFIDDLSFYDDDGKHLVIDFSGPPHDDLHGPIKLFEFDTDEPAEKKPQVETTEVSEPAPIVPVSVKQEAKKPVKKVVTPKQEKKRPAWDTDADTDYREPKRRFRPSGSTVKFSSIALAVLLMIARVARIQSRNTKYDAQITRSTISESDLESLRFKSSSVKIRYSDINGEVTDGSYVNEWTLVSFEIPEGFEVSDSMVTVFDSERRSDDYEIENSSFSFDECFESEKGDSISVELYYYPGFSDSAVMDKLMLTMLTNHIQDKGYEIDSSLSQKSATLFDNVSGNINFYDYSDGDNTRTKAIFCSYKNTIATIITIDCASKEDIEKYVSF